MRGIHNNDNLYNKYLDLTKSENDVYFKGRLGSYKYVDMCPTIEESLNFAKEICK
jgi:UDP-galactopyranose mutase